MSNKFEQLLELLINEETEKAEALFHEIVVEKSRDIYEGLADETVQEASHEEKEKKDEAEDSVDEAVEIEDEKTDEAEIKEVETKEEESIEEVGGDATDDLVKDITADEVGDAETAADDMEKDMDADAETGDTDERVADLEDALDDLKAEFEKMMGTTDKDGDGDHDMDDHKEDESLETELDPNAGLSMEAKPMMATKHDDKGMKKAEVKEYKLPVSVDSSDQSDKSAKGATPTVGGAKVKTGASGIKSTGETNGRPAPTAEKMAGDFENTGGKAKSTSYKKQEKAVTADGSDKSAKSTITGK
jgi:hypothetical protein